MPKGGLLLTDFKSMDALMETIQFHYGSDSHDPVNINRKDKEYVELIYTTDSLTLTSFLKPGVSETSFNLARRGGWMDKVRLVLISPYAVINRKDLLRAEILGRRREHLFGEGDVAFYDLAEHMVYNIHTDDFIDLPAEDLSEKGYLNTFNHVVAQAFMTSLFSEKLADFIADVHERSKLPELITGDFTLDQLKDLENGPLDNYIDMINNEWGQELGKSLQQKYAITRHTFWTPSLLAEYVNDLQNYHAWVFQIGFKPFRESDDVMIRFANKLNRVMTDINNLMEV